MYEETQRLFVETNGVRLHIVVAGDPARKPVILLHGFPEFWYGWRHQILALVEAGFRVIVPDQRGYNLSEIPKGIRPYRINELSKDVIGLVDHFGYDKAYLAGHDWGAAIAWDLAINFSECIIKLAILNVPHPLVMFETLLRSPRQMFKSWYIAFFQIPGLADWLMRLNHFSGVAFLLRSSGKSFTFTDEDIVQYKQAWSNSNGLTGMINWYRALVHHRSPAPVDVRVHVPTLILWGKKDVALSAEMAQRSVDLCDVGRLVYFEEASHWVQHDEPQGVNRALIEFFNDPLN